MSKVFKMAMGLVIHPDFTEVMQGRKRPPYVNHDTMDFERLAQAIAEAFRCPEKVTIRVANDTIDQVTLQFRNEGKIHGDPNAQDFSDALLDQSKGAKTIIDVRQRWSSMHHLNDRSHAPPPTMIQFIAQGGFESVGIWYGQAQLRMRMRSGDMFAMMTQGGPKEGDHDGHLPEGLKKEIEAIMGTPYKTHSALFNMGNANMPSWAA